MNIEQANSINLSVILEKLGHHPASTKGVDLWYHSPLHNEKTPSFHVHTGNNVWYDFGEGKGGNTVDFACAWLFSHREDHTVADALRWLDNMHSLKPCVHVPKEEAISDGATLELRKVTALQNAVFINYLHSRGIPFTLGKRYLIEAHVHNRHTGKTFSALAVPNENGGYELRNKFFKGCIASKGISFFRGRTLFPEEIHVFEGFMDFLSALVYQKTSRFEGDAIVLNSTANVSQAFPYIKDYSYKIIYSWLDNDTAGQCATKTLRDFAGKQKKLSFKAMNETYKDFKDVNAWHMHRLEL